VAQLLEWGADPVTLYQRVYEEGTPSRLRLLGEALASLSLTADGRIASLTITREMFGRTGTTEADTENFINYTLTIKGVEIGLMFTELEGVVKVSFRSKGEIWVNRLAQLFGGNGHKNAAGAKIKGEPLDVVVQRVISRASQFQER
jgi:phosphoesterase RecJ-like protein